MTNPPDNRGQWQDPNSPGSGDEPQVSYNADQFGDDDVTRTDSSAGAQQPTEYGTQQYPQYPPPQTGGYPAQTGGYPAQTGGYPAQSGGYGDQPSSGGYPATGAQPGQPQWGGPGGPATTPPKGKSKKPLLIGAGVLVAVAAVVIGLLVFTGFGGIQNGKGEIKNAAQFLTDTKSQWESELPDDGIEVSKKAGCYYVINGRDEITNEVACGPARRASTGEGEVWDMYYFTVTGSGDNQTASDPGSLKTGQKAPSGESKLVTVEGDAPSDDGLALKEPPLPRVDANSVWFDDQYVIDDKSKGAEIELDGDPRLVGPGAEVTIDSITEVDAATIDDKLMQAAEDQKFLLVAISGGTGNVSEYATNEVTFDLDGESVGTGLDPSYMSSTELLISVPEGGDSSLVLDSDGHQQSLSLTDGKRGDDPATASYYTDNPEPTVSVGQPASFPATASSAGDQFSLEMTIDDATLQPYTEIDSWAPDGQVWMTVNFTHAATIQTAGSGYSQYQIDCTGSTIDGGTIALCTSTGGGSGQLVASVPAGTASLTINMTPTLTAVASGLPDATVTYAAVPVTITF
ncbi:hypothetical protein EK0264_13905 [Epidermidibacterium keratini]|uniref:Uncharacterized protein n=1 Tax=Epidermidibacterium keratini TaxID=1891644 RepID=A0A7L4YR65_9ACTN|nr:hypothetical protein [Epidermidibacterium keratini]QHC01269.1 hypothetical protein EK0264_13905 [Epidermidibacterium keratini]